MSSTILTKHFPSDVSDIVADKTNPAVQIYGRRFYKDQTPVEYLSEFLLVFAASKGSIKLDDQQYKFRLPAGKSQAFYWPNDRINLKLFSFFPNSKLETRHEVHQDFYREILEKLKDDLHYETDNYNKKNGNSLKLIIDSNLTKEESIKLFQSLLAGFVGVAKDRTWVTHSFFPVSHIFLSREVAWLHSDAKKDKSLTKWSDAKKHFATDRHIFMARGGELLFLQITHLFSNEDNQEILSDKFKDRNYNHLNTKKISDLQESLEYNLRLLLNSNNLLTELTQFIETSLTQIESAIFETTENKNSEQSTRIKKAPLGWIPVDTLPEAFLFANELQNICQSKLGILEKLDLLQMLCCMQVLRTHCFQAQRIDNPAIQTKGFVGGYAWIVANPNADTKSGVRKMAQKSLENIEEMLYRVLRKVGASISKKNSTLKKGIYAESDKHGFAIFKKIAKEIGLVIPRTGAGARFVLPPHLLRFLVAALLAPGERIRLTKFYERAFAHYGIALGDIQIATAMAWNGNHTDRHNYAVAADTTWIEETLQQGGLLVELSDAVSIVHNPGS